MRGLCAAFVTLALLGLTAWPAAAAYHHQGEIDSPNFLAAYPDKKGSKLDSCALCHSGGSYVSGGKTTTVGSCQWCHYVSGYKTVPADGSTLNGYGKDYKAAGRTAAAVTAIAGKDSDADSYSNAAEIASGHFPGSASDDPTKKPAPSRVYSLDQIKKLASHSQFMLMNSTKSGDYYAEYSGVRLDTLLQDVGILSSATSVTVYSPDGFAQYHPLEQTAGQYAVNGAYPAAAYAYSAVADKAKGGWCDYSAPSCAGRSNGDAIAVSNGLRLLLAYARDGKPLDTGVLTKDNKLDGEGPYRVVTPQIVPSPPDQPSTNPTAFPVWPYDSKADHNSGFATRSATMIRVDPLPASYADIDTMEAGWNYVDAGKVVVYGAINPWQAQLLSEKGGVGCSVPTGSEIRRSELLPMTDASLPAKPAGATFPYGAMKFDFAVPVGTSIPVTLTFPEAVPDNVAFYKVGKSGTWGTIPLIRVSAKSVIITLTDGDAATDADGKADGVITDPGALGVLDDDGSSGCVLNPLGGFGLEWLALALAPAALWLRGRRK